MELTSPLKQRMLVGVGVNNFSSILGLHGDKLRYFSHDGQLISAPDEAAKQAQAEAEDAKAEV